MSFELTANPINPAQLREQMLDPCAGAICAYEGWVRDQNRGKSVLRLDYFAYPELAPQVAAQIIEEASGKFCLRSAAIVHRTGSLRVGEIAVWVGVTANHRGDTFGACQYLIDNVKYRLPIWKKEIYLDGSLAWIENNDGAGAAKKI